MKKQILLTLVTLLTVTSAFAEREMSRLQHVETKSCATSELQKTILETANRVMFDDTALTVLEEGLGITAEQKASGIKAEVRLTAPRSSLKLHAASVARAEASAKAGKVGVTTPAKFDVAYIVRNANNERINAGRVQIDVACRVETTADGSVKHAGSLLSFDVQAKGK